MNERDQQEVRRMLSYYGVRTFLDGVIEGAKENAQEANAQGDSDEISAWSRLAVRLDDLARQIGSEAP